jgi:hypothetical protein
MLNEKVTLVINEISYTEKFINNCNDRIRTLLKEIDESFDSNLGQSEDPPVYYFQITFSKIKISKYELLTLIKSTGLDKFNSRELLPID